MIEESCQITAAVQGIVLPQPMEFELPKFSLADVDKAGRILSSGPSLESAEGDWARDVLNNWRAAHNWPLHTVTEVVRRYATSVDRMAVVPYRIKRLPSVESKLQHRKGKLTLSQLQDIGGCRAIVDSVKSVYKIVKLCKSNIKGHRLSYENDYIAKPNDRSGYRSHHLIVEFQSERPEYARYNGIKTEIQVRSQLQHSWATTVETVDVFQDCNLKGGHGPQGWRRFFRLMSGLFAMKEGTAPVPNTPSTLGDLETKIKQRCQRYETESFLEKCRMTVTFSETNAVNAYYWLIIFDATRLQTWTIGFERDAGEQAFARYAELERELKRDRPLVLVMAKSVKDIKRAYPNYYSDVRQFLSELESITGWTPPQDDFRIIPL